MNLFRRFVFNFWYFLKPPWDTNITPPELLDFLEEHPTGSALDLGCGTGTNAITMAQRGWNVTGVDFASKAIYSARRKAARSGVQAQFLTQDVTKLDNLQKTFDLILDIGCYHSLDPQRQREYQNNLDRLLKPGGHFLLYVFFRPDSEPTKTGIIENDLKGFSTHLERIYRQDGSDRDTRPSSWLLYQKPKL